MKICVAVPYFNNIRTIYGCLDSILAGEEIPDELLLINDGSEVKPDLKNYKKVKLITHKKNLGLAAARNSALNNTTSEVIFYFDADVLVDKSYLKRAVELFKTDKCDGIGGRAVENVITEADRWRALFLKQDFGEKPVRNIWMLNGLCSAYRVSALKKVGGFDPFFRTNGEDVDAGLRLGKAGYTLYYEPSLTVKHLRLDNPLKLSNAVYNHIYYAAEALKRNGVNRKNFYLSFSKKICSYFKYALSRRDFIIFLISIEAANSIFRAIRKSSYKTQVDNEGEKI